MTDKQKQQIITLRRNGAGYGTIASQLGVSINTVKSFCRRHSLATRTNGAVCEQCGKPIAQNPGRKRKRFCSDSCRNKWWNRHLDLVKRKTVYTFTCTNCGKVFKTYGNSRRKFCCHACYIEYRFGGDRHG
jgi:endogenous inhibitor of DNA gyrase (YacG/DUF329 family)